MPCGTSDLQSPAPCYRCRNQFSGTSYKGIAAPVELPWSHSSKVPRYRGEGWLPITGKFSDEAIIRILWLIAIPATPVLAIAVTIISVTREVRGPDPGGGPGRGRAREGAAVRFTLRKNCTA